MQLLLIYPYAIAQDTLSPTTGAKKHQKTFNPDPMKATMLAVSFPGLGQVYNRKIWKIPFVYAGFGALFYAVGFNSSSHNNFMKAYQDFTDDIPETASYAKYIRGTDPAEYDPVLHPDTYNPSTASWVKDQLLLRVDYYKKYRDLSYIGIAAWYLITILDANVDASLHNFDISNSLDLDIMPARLPVPGFTGAGFNVSLKWSF